MATEKDLLSKFSNLSDDELFKILYFDQENYTEEALELAYQVFNERWVKFDSEKQKVFEKKIGIIDEREKRFEYLLETHVLGSHADNNPRTLERIAKAHIKKGEQDKGDAYISYILYRWPASEVAKRLSQEYEDDGIESPLSGLLAEYEIVEKEPLELDKIGGFLFFVAIGILVMPFLTARKLFQGIGALRAVDFSIFEYSESTFKTLMYLDLAIYLGLFCVSVFFINRFFNKKRSFPKWYISYLVFDLVYALFSLGVAKQYSYNELLILAYSKTATISFVRLCVLVPYMLKSRRAKATFVN